MEHENFLDGVGDGVVTDKQALAYKAAVEGLAGKLATNSNVYVTVVATATWTSSTNTEDKAIFSAAKPWADIGRVRLWENKSFSENHEFARNLWAALHNATARFRAKGDKWAGFVFVFEKKYSDYKQILGRLVALSEAASEVVATGNEIAKAKKTLVQKGLDILVGGKDADRGNGLVPVKGDGGDLPSFTPEVKK